MKSRLIPDSPRHHDQIKTQELHFLYNQKCLQERRKQIDIRHSKTYKMEAKTSKNDSRN